MTRGNHECSAINRIYGFYDECKKRFSIKLWKIFTECFNCLPVAALLDEKILCMHGGLSTEMEKVEQIKKIVRPTDVPEQGLLCDLLWSDPDDAATDGFGENDRGVSVIFNGEVVKNFLKNNDLDLIVRAHQVVEEGYEFFADKQLVTVFSAPNYCGEFDNAGAMMTVNEDLRCSFQILKPINKIYGFFDECKRRFNIKLWKKFNDLFNIFPITAIIKDKIFCMHGGLSPNLLNFDLLKKIVRPTEVPDSGLLCDLLWSDPGENIDKWGENERGVSYTFSEKIVEEFLDQFDLDLICRAHQVVENGYEFFANRQLVTIFSAPNYCGEFDNAGAMMLIDKDLMCTFKILKPITNNSNNCMKRPATPPNFKNK